MFIDLKNNKSFRNVCSAALTLTLMGAFVLALSCLWVPGVCGADNEVLIEKQFLGRQPEDVMIYSDSLTFSPDQKNAACVVFNEEYMQVLTNDRAGKKYDHIAKGYPIFSPAGNRVGYIADKTGNHFVVVDNHESTGYDGACCLRFSPNGKYVAYIAKEDGKQFVVMNGNRLRAYDMIDQSTGVIFSPDSQTLAYIAKNDTADGVHVVINGEESPLFDSITEISFSPDSKNTAYIISRNNEWFVFRNQNKEGPYDKAESLVWSPDAARLAYIAVKDGEFWIVDNGRKVSAGDYTPQGIFIKGGGFAAQTPRVTSPVFSLDSTLIAFTAIEKGKFKNIIGKTIGPLYDQVSRVVFSPDSGHYAYIAVSRTSTGAQMQVVRDGTAGDPYDMIDKPVFSPDSARLAYRVMDNQKWRMVVDGKAHKPYDAMDFPVFSPDSTKLAYRARAQGKWVMVENGKAQKPYDVLGVPVFSPDSAKLAYRAIDDNKLVMVANNREEFYEITKQYATLEKISRPCFSPDGKHLAYLVQANPLLCLLVINGAVEMFEASFFTFIETPLVFDSATQARFLAATINKNLFEISRIHIIIPGQP